MRTKVTLILILLNVALFAYIYYNRHKVDDTTTAILGPETSNIQTLAIARAGSDTPVAIERGTDVAWTLIQPLQWPANEFAVNRIVSELQQLRPDASFTVEEIEKGGQTLADFGLAQPPLTLTYTPASSAPNTTPKSTVLKIGSQTPTGNRICILAPDGKTIHVVNRSLAESLNLPLEELRSDTLFTIPVFEVRTFKLQPFRSDAPSVATSIGYDNSSNRWIFQSPFKGDVRANKAATVIAINQLQSLRVKEFVAPGTVDNTRTGLANPELQITLVGNNRRETLLLGAKVDPTQTTATPPTTGDTPPAVEYYAMMEDKTPVFKIAFPTELREVLDNAQEKLRDRHILDFDPANVTTVTLSAPNTPSLTLQRLETSAAGTSADLWQLVRQNGERGPQTYPADRARVEKLLEKLVRLSATHFYDAPTAADLEDYRLNRPAREISITFSNHQTVSAGAVTTLQIGTDSADSHTSYARLTTQPYVYRIDPEILADAPVSALAYRDRLLRELPAGAQIAALKLTDLADNSALLDTPLPLPATAPGDTTPLPPARRTAIETLATQLRSLRAKNLLREDFPATLPVAGEERPWRYRLDITLSLVGGTAAQTTVSTLYFSDRTGGTTQYAGSPELALVFEAEHPLIEALHAIVFGAKDPGPSQEPPATPKAP